MGTAEGPAGGRYSFSPLTARTFRDLEAILEQPGCSAARGCWCVYYRFSGKPPLDPTLDPREARRELLRAQVLEGTFVGIVAREGARPVGWCSFGPREDFPVLRRSPIMRPVDDEPVWSVVCFVVPREQRHRGVARALLAAAQRQAAALGHTLEGYPVDPQPGAGDDELWFGTTSMFRDAGFVEVARRRPDRPVMRWTP